jgi:opacity protein-like surface antigen
MAFNHAEVSAPAGVVVPSGSNSSLAAAGMIGVGYDFGAVVADVGYRGVYIAELSNGAAAPDTVWSNDNWLHEVRGTLRYRFN